MLNTVTPSLSVVLAAAFISMPMQVSAQDSCPVPINQESASGLEMLTFGMEYLPSPYKAFFKLAVDSAWVTDWDTATTNFKRAYYTAPAGSELEARALIGYKSAAAARGVKESNSLDPCNSVISFSSFNQEIIQILDHVAP